MCRVWEHQIFESMDEVVKQVRYALQMEQWAPMLSWRVIQADALAGEGDMEKRVLEELRELEPPKVVTIQRSTRKWRRNPAAGE